jgi:hypothetical protein
MHRLAALPVFGGVNLVPPPFLFLLQQFNLDPV